MIPYIAGIMLETFLKTPPCFEGIEVGHSLCCGFTNTCQSYETLPTDTSLPPPTPTAQWQCNLPTSSSLYYLYMWEYVCTCVV